jgi:tetratricopeptide (TPR) repeat protein
MSEIDQLFMQATQFTYNDSPTYSIEKAIALYSKVIEIDATYRNVLENRAQCYFRLGMHEARMNDLITLVRQHYNERHMRDIGECLYELKRYRDAVDVLQSLDLNPQQQSTFGLRLREKVYRAAGLHHLAEIDKARADAYDAEQQKLWDDPNYYGHYK